MARQQTGNPSQSATQPQQSQQDPTPQQSSQTPGGTPMSAPGADRERQRPVSREGAPTAPGTGMQRGERTGMSAATGRGATPPSLLPAFMASPGLMASAFMSNPFAFAQAMSQEMDRLFGAAGGESMSSMSPYDRAGAGAATGQSMAGGRQPTLQRWAPPLEVFQRGGDLVVRADLPGLRPEDVQIDVEDGVLTISGERREEHEDRERGFYRSERSYGAFSRSVALPEDVDEERVQARYEHGVLEVTVPIPEPQPRRGRRVEIRSGGAQPTLQAGQAGQAGQSSQPGQQSSQSSQSPKRDANAGSRSS